MRPDLDLPLQLLLHAALDQLPFEKYFQSTDELGLPLSHQVDVAKLAAAECLANFEVGDRPVLRVKQIRLLVLLL